MKANKSRSTDYAEWNWGHSVPYFCATTIHHETEIIRLIKGEGEIYVNGECFTLKLGDLYVVRPFVLHSLRRTSPSPLLIDYIKLDLRLLANNCPTDYKIGDYLHFFNDETSPSVVYGDSIRYNLDRVTVALFDEKSTREQTQKAIFNLLKVLHAARNSVPLSNMTDERRHYAVQNAVEYLTTNFDKPVKICDVASVMGYDEFYAMKLFKRFCGWSVIDYLNALRVTRAIQLLDETSDNVCAIAKRVGYSSATYFNRQFKKAFGETPVEYRRQKIDNDKQY